MTFRQITIGCSIAIFFSMPALAQQKSSSQLMRQDIGKQYLLIKDVFTKNQLSGSTRTKISSKETVDLVDCVAAYPELSSKNRSANYLAVLAGEISTASLVLTSLKYPKDVWSPLLAEYEREQLARLASGRSYSNSITEKHSQPLVMQVNAYRNAHGNRAASVAWETGCGGTGRPIKVIMRPAGGTVRLVPELWYDVCTKQGINPKNFAECDHWDSASDGEELLVSGRYWYRATLKDGSVIENKKDFSNLPASSAEWIISR